MKSRTLLAIVLSILLTVSIVPGYITLGAAQSDDDINAISFTDPADDRTKIELAFPQDLDAATTDMGDFSVKTIEGDSVSVNALEDDDSDGRLVLDMGTSYDAIELKSVTIDANAVDDSTGNAVDGQTLTIRRTSKTVVENGGDATAYKGENVAVMGDELGERIEIHTDKGQFLIGRSAFPNGQIYVFNTSLRDIATYRVIFDGDTEFNDARDAKVTLRNLGLTVTATDTQLTTQDPYIEADISSNVGNRLVRAELLTTDRDKVVSTKTFSLDGDGEDSVRFKNPGEGTYWIRVTDIATGITVSTKDISAPKIGGSSSFAKSTYTATRGSIIDVVVYLKNTDSATVQIGGEDVGYHSEFTVTDKDGNGWVGLEINTYLEGRDRINTGDSAAITTVLPKTVKSRNRDTVTNYQLLTPKTGSLKRPLDADSYDLSVAVGGDEKDLATLVLREQDRNTVQVRSAARTAKTTSPELIRENAHERNRIAVRDKVVLEIGISGLTGFLTESYNLSKGSADAEEDGAYLEIIQRNPGPNREAIIADVAATTRYVDTETDTLFVVFEPGRSPFGALEAGQIYDVSFVLDENSPFVAKDPDTPGVDKEVATSSFRLVDRTAAVTSVDGTNRVAVQRVTDAKIAGTTTLSPGSVITIRARSTGTSPFLYTNPVTVDDAGTWESRIDFSQVRHGTNFSLTVMDGSTTLASYDGRVIEMDVPSIAEFSVRAFEATTEATIGDVITVAATVRNTGEVSGPVALEYRIDDRIVASREYALDAGETRDVTFDVQLPSSIAAGSYSHGVFLAGTTTGQAGNITISAGVPRFSISNVQAPAEVRIGDDLTVKASVTNTGSADGESLIEYRLDDDTRASQSVNLAVGEETTVSFTVTVQELDPGVYRHGVFVADSEVGQSTSLVVGPLVTPTPQVVTKTVIKTPTQTATPGNPGFGIAVAVLGLLLALLVGRRFRHR